MLVSACWLIPIRFLACETACYILGYSGFLWYAFGGGYEGSDCYSVSNHGVLMGI